MFVSIPFKIYRSGGVILVVLAKQLRASYSGGRSLASVRLDRRQRMMAIQQQSFLDRCFSLGHICTRLIERVLGGVLSAVGMGAAMI
jgi:hypothetical protein